MAISRIIEKPMEEVMHDSMMPYAEYIILERSLPRVEDGLKPVQRRILFAMGELGVTPDKPHLKSARITGETLGKYHPHGDTSIYDAMVRMAQPFNMGEPLIDGHGNFGSVDGDSPAAMRYTEARLTPIALELLTDIEKDTVPFKFNFDDSLKEPEVLPAAYPNLLVNGASGIAIGVATNIPQHNLNEVVDGVIAQIKNKDISLETMMDIVKGPDFPTGGIMFLNDDLFNAYENGRGKVILRGKVEKEQEKNGKTLLVIKELPYQVNKANLLERILKISEDKKELFADIADIRDESDRDGMRAVIEIKAGGNVDKVLNGLYRYSDLQISFAINMVAIAGGKPVQLGLLEANKYYIDFRRQTVTRRTQHDLDNAKKREHILSALMIAVNDIDNVIKLIRSSNAPKEAKEKLMAAYDFTEIQAQAILDMRLQRLTALQIDTLRKEYEEVLKIIKKLEAILGSKAKLDNLIISELEEIKKKYGHERRTRIVWDESPEVVIEESKTVIAQDCQVVLADRYIRRYFGHDQSQGKFALNTSTEKTIYFFTNLGVCYSIDANKLPQGKPNDKGSMLSGLFAGVQSDERIIAVFDEMPEDKSLHFYTKNGLLKRTKMSEYQTRKSIIGAIKLKEGDYVISILQSDDSKSNLLITKNGMSIRFINDGISDIGRMSSGVKAINLAADDEVIYATQTDDDGQIIVISDSGYAKKSMLLEYEIQGRAGKGLKTFDFKKNHSNGYTLVYADYVIDNDPTYELIQKDGTATKIKHLEIKVEPRFSKGTSIVIALLGNDVEKVKKHI